MRRLQIEVESYHPGRTRELAMLQYGISLMHNTVDSAVRDEKFIPMNNTMGTEIRRKSSQMEAIAI